MGSEGLDVRIRGLGAGGDGVATLPDGRAIFVPRTAVGDTATITIERHRRRWARGQLLAVVEPSPDRREAPCVRYAECGGCQLQHLTYAAQLEAKAVRIQDALSRIGGLEATLDHVHPSPLEFGYRSRIRCHLTRGRQGHVRAGFHRLSQPGSIVDIDDECRVMDDALRNAWTALRRGWGIEAHMLPRGPSLELLLQSVTGGISLTVVGGTRWRDADALLLAVPEIDALWWKRQGSGEVEWIGGAEKLTEDWNAERLRFGASGFLQANRGAAMMLWDLLAGEVGPPEGKRIVDAYCGAGVYGRVLARHGATVIGIEVDPHAAEVALDGAPSGFDMRRGRVEEVLSELLPADLVIVNPPRQGMHPRAVKALLTNPPERLIYVSCDPATLARDLARMADRFEITRLQAIDLFPQTAHVETVVTAQCRSTTPTHP